MENYDEEKAFELLEDVTAPHIIMSNCCSGRVYMPSDEWARCMTCLEMCDIVTIEE